MVTGRDPKTGATVYVPAEFATRHYANDMQLYDAAPKNVRDAIKVDDTGTVFAAWIEAVKNVLRRR